jgi:hypothetical protein
MLFKTPTPSKSGLFPFLFLHLSQHELYLSPRRADKTPYLSLWNQTLATPKYYIGPYSGPFRGRDDGSTENDNH